MPGLSPVPASLSPRSFLANAGRALIIGIVVFSGCGGDDNNPVEMVTITGIVRVVDTAQPSPDTRVTLLGTQYASTVTTGSDGKYLIKVPKGSTLTLLTDDFNTQAADLYFPLINVDVPNIVANGNIADWPIHSCPQSSAPGHGSVAVWDQFLALGDDQHYGDQYVPTTSAQSAGVISIVVAGCENGTFADASGFSFTFDSPSFPVGYGKGEYMIDLDPARGPDFLYPSPRTVCDAAGWVLSWGDPAFTGTTVRSTCVDTTTVRNLHFVSPFDIPVRPGTISLVWYVYEPNQPNLTFKEVAHCVGLLGPGQISLKTRFHAPFAMAGRIPASTSGR